MQHLSLLVHKLGKWQGLTNTTEVPIAAIGFDGFLMGAPKLFLVELQGFFLGSLGGVGHIALPGFFDTEDFTDLTTTNKYFPEEGSSILVV